MKVFWFFLVTLLMGGFFPFSVLACIEGDRKCGSDGYVLECRGNLRNSDEKIWVTLFEKCYSARGCTNGDEKCSSTGYRLVCEDGEWDNTHNACDAVEKNIRHY